MAETERWEYRVEILRSDSEPQLAFLQERWPQGLQDTTPLLFSTIPENPYPPYTPYALQPQLDAFGEQGWELVTLQPIIIGTNGDILISGERRWATEYLCTFKKRKSD